ncbi:unnamed protein product [Cylicocyclus nassatus]|uniref:MOSC domain-containing protein n=1 Tax=Cylicocyclus nassatus TaxID=53992 RepID=A0AA36M9K1_CYLNA|nr:unnamed protein product [Cylicocyclus nassatus]
MWQERKTLVAAGIGASLLVYYLFKYFKRKTQSDLIPIGIVKELYVYPIKSCKGINVFSFFCHPLGPVSGENFDRFFVVIDGKTGRFYTARQKPVMVTIECSVADNKLTVSSPEGNRATIDIESVRQRNLVKTALLHSNLRTDGLDCGDEAAKFFADALQEPDARLLMYNEGLFTERTCVPHPDWWNNNVPKRADDNAYADLSPYMLTTQASLESLNTHLEQDVSTSNFRPNIVVDGCPAWDEDKWIVVKIGETKLQCFKPCTRCVLTTVDPKTGRKDKDMQPLKKLREFRLAPPGPMREQHRDKPIFGVNAGVDKPGHIHVGQTVYVRYKKSAF